MPSPFWALPRPLPHPRWRAVASADLHDGKDSGRARFFEGQGGGELTVFQFDVACLNVVIGIRSLDEGSRQYLTTGKRAVSEKVVSR